MFEVFGFTRALYKKPFSGEKLNTVLACVFEGDFLLNTLHNHHPLEKCSSNRDDGCEPGEHSSYRIGGARGERIG